MVENNINKYEYSNFSQNGEDGIIETLSKKLLINNKFFIEIGCGNGLENNSTNLVLNDWSGIVCDIPQNIKYYKRLLKIINPNNAISCVSGFVNLNNIGSFIEKIKDKNISFFSLDIDSFDFYLILEILKSNIFPKILCVEYNSFFGQHPITIKYNSNFKRYSLDQKRGLYFGAGINAWKMLLNKYNYKFICVDSNGVNAFFILPEFFDQNINEYTGLEFSYTRTFVEKYKMNGHILEKELISEFKDNLINVSDLI